ncbi:MAG: hypothetical protein IT384_27060 [Deltaproteobacteria bacterium]|nr:hypothetical protein [Deltaproteobacteria bacterium]
MSRTPIVLGLLVSAGFGCASSPSGAADSGGGDARQVTGVDAGAPVIVFEPIPENLALLAAGLRTLVNGGEADFDGDEITDFVTTIDGDTRTIQALSFGLPVLTVVHRSPDQVEVSGDLEVDGVPDYRGSSVRSNGTMVERHAWDPDEDGVDDRVRDIVFEPIGDRSTARMTITERVLAGDPPALAVTWMRSDRTQEELGDGPCDGMVTRPPTGGSSRSPLGQPNISVITNGQPGACDQAQSAKIVSAFNQALAEGLPCLKESNPRAYERLNESLADRPLAISCGNDCNFSNGTYSIAQTDMPGSWVTIFRDPSMSLNMAHFPSGDCAASVMLHELLHWAGEPHASDATGEGGQDQVYACGRFCMKCMTDPACGSGGGDQAHDCAKCAEPTVQKEACGIRQDRVLHSECSYRCAEFEHCGVSGSQPAASCMYLQDRYCDGTEYRAGGSFVWACIASCPGLFPYPCGAGCTGDDAMEGVETPCPKPARCP